MILLLEGFIIGAGLAYIVGYSIGAKQTRKTFDRIANEMLRKK